MNEPWKCPRCNTINAPWMPQCNCKPIKRDYCSECFSAAIATFNRPLPSVDVIEAWAEDFHKNTTHHNNKS